MNQSEIGELLEKLRSESARDAWGEFLSNFSDLIYKTAYLVTSNSEMASDCFVYSCEELCRQNFKRLLKFRPEGPASFETWLRAVVRNLSVDWQRKEFGRERIFQCIAQLPAIDQEIFTLTYFRGLSTDDCFAALAGNHARLMPAQIEESLQRIASVLTPRQIWLLNSRRPRMEPLEEADSASTIPERPQVQDPAPGPPQALEAKQLSEALGRALKRLPANDRLLVKLRYVQGLTLQEVAAAVGLKDAQSADRALKEILAQLRKELGEFA